MVQGKYLRGQRLQQMIRENCRIRETLFLNWKSLNKEWATLSTFLDSEKCVQVEFQGNFWVISKGKERDCYGK